MLQLITMSLINLKGSFNKQQAGKRQTLFEYVNIEANANEFEMRQYFLISSKNQTKEGICNGLRHLTKSSQYTQKIFLINGVLKMSLQQIPLSI